MWANVFFSMNLSRKGSTSISDPKYCSTIAWTINVKTFNTLNNLNYNQIKHNTKSIYYSVKNQHHSHRPHSEQKPAAQHLEYPEIFVLIGNLSKSAKLKHFQLTMSKTNPNRPLVIY